MYLHVNFTSSSFCTSNSLEISWRCNQSYAFHCITLHCIVSKIKEKKSEMNEIVISIKTQKKTEKPQTFFFWNCEHKKIAVKMIQRMIGLQTINYLVQISLFISWNRIWKCNFNSAKKHILILTLKRNAKKANKMRRKKSWKSRVYDVVYIFINVLYFKKVKKNTWNGQENGKRL